MPHATFEVSRFIRDFLTLFRTPVSSIFDFSPKLYSTVDVILDCSVHNDVRGRSHLCPRDRLFLIYEFEHVVIAKEISTGKMVICNTPDGFLGSIKFRKVKVFID